MLAHVHAVLAARNRRQLIPHGDEIGRGQRRQRGGHVAVYLQAAARPQVQHGGATPFDIGHLGGDGRPVDAVHGFEHIACNGHQGACIAG